jgi:hypothetical protein
MLTTLILIITLISGVHADADSFIAVAKERRNRLQAIVESCLPVDCPKTAFLQVTGKEPGQSGNHAIAFVHGIWLAKKTNSTLLAPHWMMEDVASDAIKGGLQRCYCFIPEEIGQTQILGNSNIVRKVSSPDLFLVFQLLNDERLGLPKYSMAVVDEVSDVYVHAYSAMRSVWHESFEEYAKAVISTPFAGTSKYTGAHRRELQGYCDKWMIAMNHNVFNGSEIPLRGAYWEDIHPSANGKIAREIKEGRMSSSHPLCSMELSFVRDTQAMHSRSNQPIYLASDGQGILSDYINSHDVAGTAIGRPKPQWEDGKVVKYFDMFMLLNADFALLNPRSTFSWEVFVVRAALGLLSVPKPVGIDCTSINREHMMKSTQRTGPG